MRQRSTSPIWWLLLGGIVIAVLGIGLVLMPRLLSSTTYVPPTPTPTRVPPTEAPVAATSAPAEASPSPSPEPPTPLPTSALPSAPDFTLPGAKGTTVTLTDQLAQGPVVVVFFQRVGG
jgi:hypothetical protein